VARGISAGMSTEAKRPAVTPIVLFQGEFVSGMVYFWTGIGQLSWNSLTWAGAGSLIGISPIAHSSGLRADGVVVTLSGVPNSLVTKALSECKHKHKATIYFGLLDARGVLVADPVPVYVGSLDIATLKKGAKNSTIAISYETRLLDKRPRNRRYTQEDQALDYPGDLGFAYVNDLQDKVISTGTGSSAGAGSGAGGCFSGNTRYLTPTGEAAIAGHIDGSMAMTHFGPRPARLHAHDFDDLMLDMGHDELVTFEHEMRQGAGFARRDFVEARTIWSRTVRHTGKVYTLEILTDRDEERHFRLANGETAHNKQNIGPIGG
jgi:hypothetical protein